MEDQSKQGSPTPGLLSNPELLGALMKTLSAANTTNTVNTTTAARESERGEATSPSSAGGLPEGLGALLSDPNLVAKLPQMMATLGPVLAGLQKPTAAPSNDRAKCRDDLLCALRPFLSPSRASAVDTILRLEKLGTVLKGLS